MKERIKVLAESFLDEIVAIRRHFHTYPELAFQEEKTAEFIALKLKEWGIPYQAGVAKTGIVATITGHKPGKTIALRADMDALPILETNPVSYKSLNEGIMHACGHDVHMASLLGVAKILQELRSHFSGEVRLIFQPSEEAFPGGASVMIKEGVLENPTPACILGQHTLPTLEAGKVGMKSGKYMASTDEVYLTVKGRGGHAATPELNVDPIIISARILLALQEMVREFADPQVPTVLSFGKIVGNGRTNIIPDQVKLDGTLRTFDENWRREAHAKITSIAQNIAQENGGDCEVFIDKGYPFLVNDESLTQRVFEKAKEYLGQENVVDLDMRLTAEDFAYYSQVIPGCFYRLGTRNEAKGITSNLHTPTFDVDEKSLLTGMGLMAWFAVMELR